MNAQRLWLVFQYQPLNYTPKRHFNLMSQRTDLQACATENIAHQNVVQNMPHTLLQSITL